MCPLVIGVSGDGPKVILQVHTVWGQWTKTVGTTTTDTECVECDAGMWCKVSPTSSTLAERKKVVCRPHRICLAGQWTKTVGNTTKDTECIYCDAGTWRAVAPTSSAIAES